MSVSSPVSMIVGSSSFTAKHTYEYYPDCRIKYPFRVNEWPILVMFLSESMTVSGVSVNATDISSGEQFLTH